MSVVVKLENGLLVDCIIYDDEGIDEKPNIVECTSQIEVDLNKMVDKKDIINSIPTCFIEPLDSNDTKFGEIYFSKNGAKFYFVCCFCSKSYFKIEEYVEHCEEDHNICSWKVFDLLNDKSKLKDNRKNTIKYEYENFEQKLKDKSEHDHTYDRNFSRKYLLHNSKSSVFNVQESSLLNSGCNEIEKLNENFEFKNISQELEFLNEECLDPEFNEKLKQFQILEDSDESTDFEDPTDLTKIKRCEHCLTKVVNFKMHMRTKHYDLLYKCVVPSCYEVFLTERRLKDHLSSIHRDPEKPFACKNCNYKTNKKGSLDVHFKRIHLNIRNKKCSFCSKTFYDSGELKKHERVHTGERPAICYVCGKGLRTTQDLNKHILREHGEPTFCCNVCGKKFHLKETLLKHNFVHTNERPHICHVCGKGFKHVKYLREHMDLHSGVKKYECKICGKRFAQKNNYTGHQKIHNRTKLDKK